MSVPQQHAVAALKALRVQLQWYDSRSKDAPRAIVEAAIWFARALGCTVNEEGTP